MANLPFFRFVIMLLCSGLLISCSKSNDQRKFEKQALSFPENITEYNANGQPIENRDDPDDWRIGPDFSGLIKIQTPAHPNPVNLNSSITIDIDVAGFEAINGLEIYVFRDPANLIGPIFISDQSPLPPGVTTVILDPSQFAQSGSGSQLYRILIYDNRENLISYGDLQVN
ncbi:MAG: hypothetical protein U5J95_05520 [Balneolaceae bacterium]|nr:hypothetical protein [Balneolaceae bacterium]